MTKKATATAPSNLAFIKYWGKRDVGLRIPTNNSISVNLSNATTRTSVVFDEELESDQLQAVDSRVLPNTEFFRRTFKQIDRIRTMAGINTRASITTRNSFPDSVGIASSASGFAALTMAACSAAGLELSQKELSELSRLGSGSACRSIPDGFVEWIALDENNASYAIQLAPPDHWDIQILSVILSTKSKEVSSSSGHNLASASPFFNTRLGTLDERLDIVRSAILARDFDTFGRETEKEALSFHSIAMTSPHHQSDGSWSSGIFYWLPESLELILAVQTWRKNGIQVYFTMDAGPTIHLICLRKDLEVIQSQLNGVEKRIPKRKWNVLVNSPSVGARLEISKAGETTGDM
ncbi:diphosphomevalonate decarboxylase [Chloroflexota bacterium]